MKLATLFLLCCGVAMGQTGKVTLIVPTQMPDCCYRIHDQEITLVGSEDWPDVPAVQVTEHPVSYDKLPADKQLEADILCLQLAMANEREHTHATHELCDTEKWTCADKSRILLTAENGSRWCHKIQAGPEPIEQPTCPPIGCQPHPASTTPKRNWAHEFGLLP